MEVATGKITTLQTEIAALHKEKATMRAESSAIEAELRRERDQAQEQISLFLDQTRNEKDALQTQEAKLS